MSVEILQPNKATSDHGLAIGQIVAAEAAVVQVAAPPAESGIVLDLTQTGSPTADVKRRLMGAFGVAMMVRGNPAEPGFDTPDPHTAGRTHYTRSTQAATSKSTAPRTKDGPADQQGDTRTDSDVFTDQT